MTRKRWLLPGFCFLAAACFLAVCSRSSFLYPMNDWVDVNAYVTLARAMHAGKRIYTDIYDQKGPLLYYIYYVLTAFENCYLAEYVLEVVCYGLFLFFAAQCAALYAKRAWTPYAVVLALAAVVPASNVFSLGGSVEELCLFMMMHPLYATLRAIRRKTFLTGRQALLFGAYAGVILWIKYTMLGFYAGLALFIAVWFVQARRYAALGRVIGCFLAGLAIVSALTVSYFVYHGTLGDLWTAYFYNNIFIYSDAAAESAGSRIFFVLKAGLKNTLRFARKNPVMAVLLALGAADCLTFRTDKKTVSFAEIFAVLLPMAGVAFCSLFLGKDFDYYGMPLAVFAPFGAMLALKSAERLRLRLRPAVAGVLSAALFAGALAADVRLSQSTELLLKSRDEMTQYQFAEIINQVEGATLLNYGFQDAGFYYAADVVPVNKFYMIMNLPLDEMYAEQVQCVEEGRTDFVITKGGPLEWMSVDDSNYVCVAQPDEFVYYGNGEYGMNGYFLYRRKW